MKKKYKKFFFFSYYFMYNSFIFFFLFLELFLFNAINSLYIFLFSIQNKIITKKSSHKLIILLTVFLFNYSKFASQFHFNYYCSKQKIPYYYALN